MADQEAFIAGTAEEAWAWAAKVRPEDNGALVRFVRVGQGPRLRIVGEWLICDDLVPRPCVRGRVAGADGTFSEDDFLIDTGADRTVFSAGLLAKLGILTVISIDGDRAQGIGGNSAFVLLTTVLELTRDDGGPAHIRGEFAAFIDPNASDLSILGRDVFYHFDVILSRRRNEVLLLAPNHQYRVELI